MRRISGIKWARACERPACIPVGRPRGAKAEGIRYEKKLGTFLDFAKRGCWFEYEDSKGHGWCQMDYLFGFQGTLFVLEVKYTYTEAAWAQLEELYFPVLRAAFNRPVRGIQVCKRLDGPPRSALCASLAGAIPIASLGRRVVWQWLGSDTTGTQLPSPVSPSLARAVA